VLEPPGKKFSRIFLEHQDFFEFQIFLRRNENFPGKKNSQTVEIYFFEQPAKLFSQEFSRVPKILGNMEIVFVETGGDRELSDRSCGRCAVLEFENLQFVKGKRDDAPRHMPPSTQTRAFHAHALLPEASTAKWCGTRVNYLTGPFGKHPKFTCRSRF
jgi:hypothetical protein